ncbi:MAG: DUF1178 family protein [Hyphomicrobiaceae bacterium]
MIKYQLICPKSHSFEGWFSSSSAYDAQRKKRQVRCPECGSAKIEKALMAPSVVTSERATTTRGEPAAVPPPAAAQHVAMPPEARELMQRMRKLRDEILAKSEYVGPKFAEEARRMHEEDAGQRAIHGEATRDEVEALVEDGIDVLPIPVLPDDHN